MKHKLLFIIAGLLILIILPGCMQKNPENIESSNESQEKNTQQEMNIAVYYVKYTQDDTYLVREIHTVNNSEEPLKTAVEELIKGSPVTEGASRIIPQDTEVIDVQLKNTHATVNFTRDVLDASTGSTGELLGIQSIVNTLTEFPDVESVSFEVEGKTNNRIKDWWGHVGLYEQPFQKNLSNVHEPAIWVTCPQPGQVIGIPMLVKGSARVFEGTVTVRVINDTEVLVEKTITAEQGAPGRGDFETSLKFEPPESGEEGKLEVYSTDARDGTPTHIVTIPVKWP